MASSDAWIHRHERWMYRGGHPNRMARVLNRMWAIAAGMGLLGTRVVVLRVRGRTSGRVLSSPLIVADHAGQRFFVAMLGERTSWVANVRAADGFAVLDHGRREHVRLVEVPAAERAPILRRHLKVAPAARSFVPADPEAPLAEFERVAGQFPVFRVERG